MISYKLEDNIDINELSKQISFISEDIISFEIKEGILVLEVKENANENQILESLNNLTQNCVYNNDVKTIHENNPLKNYYTNTINDELLFLKFEDGLIGLTGKALFLFEYFDREFEKMAMEEGAERKKYPVLLPLKQYKKTGYMKKTPQYSMFCCSANENLQLLNQLNKVIDTDIIVDFINNPKYALSPSACFHTYLEFENKNLEDNSVFTFIQSVFRNEGRFNFFELGRLRDYHVREIVFFGDADFINDKRKRVMEKVVSFAQKLNINYKLSTANDPFILPKLQKVKKIQLLEKTKYELQLFYDKEKSMSCASFNIHGKAFTSPFNITVKGENSSETGCIGFGIERWVISFLSQFGEDIRLWPKCVRDEYQKAEENE